MRGPGRCAVGAALGALAVAGVLALLTVVAWSVVGPGVAEALTGPAAASGADPDSRRRLGLPVLVASIALVGESACLLRVLAAEPVPDHPARPAALRVPRPAP